VLNALVQAERPLTAYQVLDRLRGAGLSSPPTVYRALDRLIADGRAHRLETLHAFVACARGDLCGRAAFAICRQCGRVDEIADNGASALDVWADGQAFMVEKTTVEMLGICAWCRRSPAVVTQQEGPAE
jgi:Fur family zinc uptake transcriptional regulator